MNTNYRPFGKLNLFLGAVTGVGTLLFGVAVSNGDLRSTPEYYLFLVAAIVSVVILFMRNRKLDSMAKTIGYTLLLTLVGALIYLFAFCRWGFSMIPGGGEYKSFFGTIDSITSGRFANERDTYDYQQPDFNTSVNSNSSASDNGSEFTKYEDAKAQEIGYANAEDYQNRTGFSGHNIDPDNI